MRTTVLFPVTLEVRDFPSMWIHVGSTPTRGTVRKVKESLTSLKVNPSGKPLLISLFRSGETSPIRRHSLLDLVRGDVILELAPSI